MRDLESTISGIRRCRVSRLVEHMEESLHNLWHAKLISQLTLVYLVGGTYDKLEQCAADISADYRLCWASVHTTNQFNAPSRCVPTQCTEDFNTSTSFCYSDQEKKPAGRCG